MFSSVYKHVEAGSFRYRQSLSSLALEVTCAAILSGAAHPPTSPTAAFVLFLSMVASHDWNSTPLCAPGSSIGTLSRSIVVDCVN